ncbi:MAG TPA: PKD domain-containing protein [Pyrinomonadaceae bacterium]|nr:PKD domain-containing protein [Pyrinomonadaceae bacterium]
MKQKLPLSRRTPARRFLTHRSMLLIVLSLTLLTSVLVSAADSDLDSSFDGDGIVTTDHAEFEQINDIVIQPDGKTVAVGHSGIFHGFFQQSFEMIIARYNIDGSLDPTFGSGGIVTTDIGGFAIAFAVALQPDGKIVVGGRGDLISGANFTVVRYNTDGSLDATFGGSGVVTTPIGFFFSQITDLSIQADGKIVVVGDAALIGAPVVTFVTTLARYNADGSLDATFDGDGVSQPIPSGSEGFRTALPVGMALQTTQKIVVAQTCIVGTNQTLCVSRYNSDGSLDNAFDGDGVAATEFDSSSGGLGQAVTIQPDDKIVAVGHIFTNIGGLPGLARFNNDGSPDNSFDGDGRVLIANSVQFGTDVLAVQPNGKILMAGSGFVHVPSFHSVMAVIRCNPDGSIDDTFGSSGLVTTSVGTGDSAARGVALQADGRIVAGGFGNVTIGDEATFSDLVLVRYGAAINHPPVVTITGPPSGSAFAVNTPVNFTGSFIDDPGDTHVITWIFESITQPQTIVVPVLGALPGTANTMHTFTDAGIYKVSLRVIDNNFLSTTATTVNGLEVLVVIYDPSGGWVSGGGWIDSPPGAFAAMPELKGKANFGFVSRYQIGASVPTGNIHFQFDSLDFQSMTYEWLVLSGSKALCKGVGTINGTGSYRFILTIIDGDQPGGDGQDKFRLRIWSESDGVIYDNELNAPDGSDPTTILGGGSIAIHH